LALLFVGTLLLPSGCENANALGLDADANLMSEGRIRGVHYFFHRGDGVQNWDRLVENHVGEVVIVPYAFQAKYDEPTLSFQGRGRRSAASRDSVYRLMAEEVKAKGMDVIVKPHIWMRSEGGKWRSDIQFSEMDSFAIWAKSYSEFILHYAKLSEEIGASHFCVGTELAALTRGHNDYWRALIKDVRAVYSGKIFYAANWYEEYEHISFWKDLDYVGVQAYFPLCKDPNPSLEDLMAGWKSHLSELRKFSRKVGRPILFSEVGYKSTNDAAVNPWEWISHSNTEGKVKSIETQALCYEAFFRTFWNQPWFAGALIWQWQSGYDADPTSTEESLDFTPQHKPAMDVMAKWFAKS